MGKFAIGARVRDDDGDEGVITAKRKGERFVLYDDVDYGSLWRSKSALEVVANDNEASPCAPVFEKEYSVGDRVRFIRDNPNGGKNYGAAGEEFVVAGTTDVRWDGEDQIKITHPKLGFDPAVPVSAINRIELAATPTPKFAKGDRALSHNGDYVTVDTDPDSANHVWVSFGKTEWRTPVSWLTKWEPKVGDRVNWTRVRGEFDGSTIESHEGLLFDWKLRATNGNSTYAYSLELEPAEPLPVAEQPAAELWAPVAGKFGKTRDGRKVGPILEYNDEWFHIQSGQDLGDMLWHLNGEADDAPSADLVAEWVEPAHEEVAVAESPEPAAPPAKFKVGDRVNWTYSRGSWQGIVIESIDDSQVYWIIARCPRRGTGAFSAADLELAPTLPIGSTVTFTATGRLSAINDNGHMQVVFKDLAPAQNSFALPAEYVSLAN